MWLTTVLTYLAINDVFLELVLEPKVCKSRIKVQAPNRKFSTLPPPLGAELRKTFLKAKATSCTKLGFSGSECLTNSAAT
jgi:hypothetical protein